MALNAGKIEKTGGSKFPPAKPLEPGSYPARVVQILSLGLQKQQPFKGEEKAPKQEIYVTYELLDEFMENEDGTPNEERPRWISETFSLNSIDSDLATSTKRYLALDADLKYGGDWAKVAGTPCTVVLTQRKGKKDPEKVYNNVASISTMRAKEAAKAPDLVNAPKVFDIDEPDMEVFWSLPEWIQTKMKENLEYGGSALEKLVQAGKPAGGGEGKEKAKAAEKPAEDPSEDDDDGEEKW